MSYSPPQAPQYPRHSYSSGSLGFMIDRYLSPSLAYLSLPFPPGCLPLDQHGNPLLVVADASLISVPWKLVINLLGSLLDRSSDNSASQ